jgi:hypothetical protein
VSVSEADCKALSSRLWVRVENRGFCVRFWLSTAGGSKDEALVAFNGDIGGRIDGKLQLVEQARSVSDESLQKAADYGSRLYRGPYFWIARPGAFGSSGHLGETVFETLTGLVNDLDRRTSVQIIQEYCGKQATPSVFATRLGD